MNIEKKADGEEMTFVFTGWLDTQAAPVLDEAVKDLSDDVKSLVFDFGGVEYISSSGIRQLVAAHKKMGGNLKLLHVSADILDVLNMTGVSKRLKIE
ncbi:MAG: STAS domain-containing protein [Lachnospiraceae bacterium]|nr:STAS domain-containing protein [Lachnospiraceae bacterium]